LSTIAWLSFGIYNKYHPDIKKEVVRPECSQCKFQSRNVRIGEGIGFAPARSRRIFSGIDYPPTDSRDIILRWTVSGCKGEEGAGVDSMNASEVLGRGGCRTFLWTL